MLMKTWELVMKLALSPLDKLRAAGKFLNVTFNGRPLTVSIEVTKRCNARCDFCDYWKTKDRDELADFTEAVRRFDPLVVVITGGEPMIRRDLIQIIRKIKALPGFRYITLLTHGGLLTESKVKELITAGVHQINVSMNYPDERQDRERGIPDLFARLEKIIPKMVAEGYGVFALAAMLMVDNMHEAEALVRLAHKWGVNIAFSGYNDLKNGNQNHFVDAAQMAEFKAVCRRIIALKRELRNVMTSDYFFETLPRFYEKRWIDGCRAGKIMLHVTPKGMVQPCAELAPISHYSQFKPRAYTGPNCGACFDACRSEPQAPLNLRRIGELTGIL